ncbi:MAG: YeeE/YedE family protein [Massilia sp.]
MKIVMALLAGLVFGLGLIVSGMTNPSKVQGFLDLAGRWDPSLAFVMGGALLVGMLSFPFALKRPLSLLGESMRLPTSNTIDRRLVIGSTVFGIGWGLAGYCPGPALVSLTLGGAKPWLFFIAMLAGMLVFEVIERIRVKAHSAQSA